MCIVLTFIYSFLETIVDLNDTLMKYVSISNQSYEKALEDYDIKKSQKQELEKENGFIKPAKLVRFESPNAEVTNFARKILDTSPSEAKRARNDGPYRPEKVGLGQLHCTCKALKNQLYSNSV